MDNTNPGFLLHVPIIFSPLCPIGLPPAETIPTQIDRDENPNIPHRLWVRQSEGDPAERFASVASLSDHGVPNRWVAT